MPLGKEQTGCRCGWAGAVLECHCRECHVNADPEAGQGGLLTAGGLEALGPWL